MLSADRLAAGDDAAFAALYTSSRDRLFRFAVRMLSDADAAHDVVQETFLRARMALHTVRDTRSVEGWLFAIARNQVIGQMRRLHPERGVDPEELAADGDPLEDVIKGETAGILRCLVDKLKPEYREVLLLREYEQLSYAEIAAITGATEDVVGMRLLRARKALVRLVRPYMHREGGHAL